MATVSIRRHPWAALAQAWRGIWSGPITSSSPELARLWAAPSTSTGVHVSEQTALAYAPLFACVRNISEDVASAPLILYKRDADGDKTRYTDSKLYRLLHDEPNPEMSSMVFRQTVTAHALTWGNGYAEIERDGQGRPFHLWPLTPDRVMPYRDSVTGRVWYRVAGYSGGDVSIPAADMLHVPGLGYDGLLGYSVVAKARESVGLGLATERFGGTFFGNGSSFGGVFEHPGTMTTAAQKNFKESIAASHTGVERAHRFLIVEEGMKYQRLGIPPNDAQFLETRMFQLEEQCRWFRMPPHKIQHLLRSTNNNIEHQGIEYYTDTLRPWFVRWEQEINRKLVSPLERRFQFAEHLIDGVLRGDIQSRYAAYAVGRQWGWLSANNICEKENMNKLPGTSGDIYLVPLNMTPADRINDVIDAQVRPPPAPVAPKDDPPKDDQSTTDEVNAAEMIAEIRKAIAAAEERAEAYVEKVAQAQAAAESSIMLASAKVHEEEARTLAAAHAAAIQEVNTLRSALLLAQEQAARSQTEREAADAARAAAEQEATAVRIDAGAVIVERDEAVKRATDAERAVVDAREEHAFQARIEAAIREVDNKAERVRLEGLVTEALAKEAETARTLAEREAHTTKALADFADREAASVVLTTANGEAITRLESEVTAQRERERVRMQGVIGAHRSLIADAMGRMIRRETEKARRAQATPEKMRAWVEAFYPSHVDIVRAALLPAIRTHLAWQQSEEDPSTLAGELAKAHVTESIRQLRAALDSEPEDYAESLETLLRRWELERSDAIADQILREEVSHATTHR